MNLSTYTKNILKLMLIILAIVLSIYLVFKVSLYFMPFIIAFAISSILEPAIKFLVNKARISRKLASLITILVMLSTIGLIISVLIIKLITQVRDFYNSASDYYAIIYNSLNTLITRAKTFYTLLPVEVSENIGSILTNLTTSFVNFLNTLAKGVLNTAISLPEAFVFLLVTIISTYFICSDRKNIADFFETQVPQNWLIKASNFKNEMFSALFGYIRAQLILMTVTFSQLSIGLWIIGIKNYILIALLISFVDALPVLGTGGIMVPWAAYFFIVSDIKMGISLLVLYAIVLVVRNLIEPKVLGEQIGIHPLLTLVAMYAGLKILGVSGLIIGPITVLTVRNILKAVFKKQSLKDYLEKKSITH